jgi:PTH2 family peptidyl-tRNA hydrolase
MIKQVIVMRTDLGMRKGKMIAQGAHASMEFIRQRLLSANGSGNLALSDVELQWLSGDHTKVCVGIDDESALLAILEHAKLRGVTAYQVVDLGKTEFNGQPTLTCVAIGPDTAERVDSITGGLKLL